MVVSIRANRQASQIRSLRLKIEHRKEFFREEHIEQKVHGHSISVIYSLYPSCPWGLIEYFLGFYIK